MDKTKLEIPAGFAGDTEWVQLITKFGRWRHRGGAWQQLRTAPGLDTTYPSSLIPASLHTLRTAPGLDTTYPYTDLNTFLRDLPGRGEENADDEVAVDDSFTDIYMFKPNVTAADIFVPLQKVVWNWYAHADNHTGQWTVDANNSKIDPGAAENDPPKKGVDWKEFPQWTHNCDNDLHPVDTWDPSGPPPH